jgi:predicted phage terminase large subunit-like protein
MYWHRWFAWRPVIVYSRAGRWRIVWLHYVERRTCLKILVQDNKYFVASAVAGQWEYYDLEQPVLSRAEKQKPDAILIEDAGFGTALISALKQRGMPVIAVQPEGDKKTRLLRQVSKFANGQVFLL